MGNRGPAKSAGKRTPAGRLSRAQEEKRSREMSKLGQEEWSVMSTALMARNRVHGMSLKAPKMPDGKYGKPPAHDPRSGSVIGRLAMMGPDEGISRVQADAAMKYAEDWANYYRAICAPPLPGAVDLNAVRGGSSTELEHVAFVARAKRRWLGEKDGPPGVVAAVQECQNHHRGTTLFAALYAFIIEDRFHRHMIGDLRIALNGLCHHYGLNDTPNGKPEQQLAVVS